MKALSILGGRPHLIKAESVHRAFLSGPNEHLVIRAGLSLLSDYPSDRDFVLPEPRARLTSDDASDLAGAVRDAVVSLQPDVILLYGDLPTTMAALTGVVGLAVPIVHIEAGYRSGDLLDPEEHTRLLVDHVAAHRIAYSDRMVANLVNEGLPEKTISVFADPATLSLARHIEQLGGAPAPQSYGLVAFHHDENLLDSDRLRHLLGALVDLASHHPLSPCARAAGPHGLMKMGMIRASPATPNFSWCL